MHKLLSRLVLAVAVFLGPLFTPIAHARWLTAQEQASLAEVFRLYQLAAESAATHQSTSADTAYWNGQASGYADSANAVWYVASTDWLADIYYGARDYCYAQMENETDPDMRASWQGQAEAYDEAGDYTSSF